MSNLREILLYSGGLDSFLTYQYLTRLGHKLRLVYFNMHTKYAEAEMALFKSSIFKSIMPYVEIRNELNFCGIEQEDAYVPDRNLIAILATHAIAPDVDVIYIGSSLSDRVNDNNKEVFEKLSDLLSTVHERKISVTSPFLDKHKCDIMKSFIDSNMFWTYPQNYNISTIAEELTFSCYYPTKDEDGNWHECQSCPACLRKNVVLNYAGLFRPMKQTCSDLVDKYYHEADSKLLFHESNFHEFDNMVSRFKSTVDYVDHLHAYWERENDE